MTPLYYFAASTDSGCVAACSHLHQTVHAATACIQHPGGYVIAVEDELLRDLTEAEEREFQVSMYGNETSGYPSVEGKRLPEHALWAQLKLRFDEP